MEHAEQLCPCAMGRCGSPHLQQTPSTRTSLVQSQMPIVWSYLPPKLPQACAHITPQLHLHHKSLPHAPSASQNPFPRLHLHPKPHSPGSICIPHPFPRLPPSCISKLGPASSMEVVAAAGHPARVRICPHLGDSSSPALWLLTRWVR